MEADINVALDETKTQKEKREKVAKDIELFESFVIGQGKLHILMGHHCIRNPNGIEQNGPVFIPHSWNMRATSAEKVKEFIDSQGGPHRIFPLNQEYAITIAVTRSLIDNVELGKYRGIEFPDFRFNNANGEIHIVNGHHRIAAWKEINKLLLDNLSKVKKVLGPGLQVASDQDTNPIVKARDQLLDITNEIFTSDGWGAIILDFGKYYKLNGISVRFTDIPLNRCNPKACTCS